MSQNQDTKPTYDRKAYREANREKIKAARKIYHEKNKEAINARKRRARKEGLWCPGWKGKRVGVAGRRIKVEPIMIDMLMNRCRGRCECCKVPFSLITKRRPNIDHCHSTGMLRGVLCTMCNLALGHARDNPRILRALIRYLKEHQPGIKEVDVMA